MIPNEKKLARLSNVAQMYYEQDMTQSDIAKIIDVSRPMVSKLLAEAKELGVVTITINQIQTMQQMLSDKLKGLFSLKSAVVVESVTGNPSATNESIVRAAYIICDSGIRGTPLVGVGCGSTIGALTDLVVSEFQRDDKVRGEIFPLIGGLKAAFRSYHTNELVRSFSESTGLKASYLYLPALVESDEEKQLFQTTGLFRDIEEKWDHMTVSLINVSNLFSTPDLATSIRFGKRLTQNHAVGRFLAHYYDEAGTFIQPEYDNVVQISVEQLQNAETVIAMCGSNLDPKAVLGALRTGVVTHVVLSDELALRVCELAEQ